MRDGFKGDSFKDRSMGTPGPGLSTALSPVTATRIVIV
jgi:hypothetical protein